VLTVRGVNQYYGGSHILREVGFEVPAGRLTALLGRNGVGKTTLLRCLMGLLPIRTGEIRFAGRALGAMPSYARAALGMAYVPQGREIFPRLTVRENLLVGLAVKPRGSRVPDLVFELFPVLRDMLDRRGGDLSGGQQQQLAIGRALASEPRLLVLDEPTEGIQPSIIKDIERALRRLVREHGMTVLLVEQYYDFARTLADHYAVISRGEIVRTGEGRTMDEDGVRAFLAV
jgi:urea transport system ATP-binding protein